MKNKIKYTLLICSVVLFSSCETSSKSEIEPEKTISEEPEVIVVPPVIKYNFVLDSFNVAVDTVQQNQGLTHILPKYGVSLGTIYTIAEKFDSIFNVKKIKSGHKYTVLSHQEDTNIVADYFIYEINSIDYLVYDFGTNLNAYIESKDVFIDTLSAGGVITSSLWNSFVGQGLSPALVMEVAKLYAWSIDFFDIQKNDFYKVIYESKKVEGKFIGVGDILAVQFNHRGDDYYFFKYSSDSINSGYFSEKGDQMEKALLSAPLEYKRVSSKFSNNRFHPVLKIYRPHHGVDYAAAIGTEVVATGSGKITYAARAGGAGNLVKIQHDIGDIETKYMHLSKFGPGIKKGVHVMQGQKIGEVGSTGTSTGPHLDYRVYINGKAVDPLGIDIPSVDPLKDSALIAYLDFIKPIKIELNNIESILLGQEKTQTDSTSSEQQADNN